MLWLSHIFVFARSIQRIESNLAAQPVRFYFESSGNERPLAVSFAQIVFTLLTQHVFDYFIFRSWRSLVVGKSWLLNHLARKFMCKQNNELRKTHQNNAFEQRNEQTVCWNKFYTESNRMKKKTQVLWIWSMRW